MPSRRAAKKLRAPEWQVLSFMMNRALEAVVRQISKLDRNHDIPYLAGYSKDGKTIHIDRHMPKSFSFRRHRVKTDRFLILHEAVEKTLMDHLGCAICMRTGSCRVQTTLRPLPHDSSFGIDQCTTQSHDMGLFGCGNCGCRTPYKNIIDNVGG